MTVSNLRKRGLYSKQTAVEASITRDSKSARLLLDCVVRLKN